MSEGKESLDRLVKEMFGGKSPLQLGIEELRAVIQTEMTSSIAVWTMSLSVYTFARQELGIQASESDRLLLTKELLRQFLNGLHKGIVAHFNDKLSQSGDVSSAARFVTKQIADGSLGSIEGQVEEIAELVKQVKARLEAE